MVRAAKKRKKRAAAEPAPEETNGESEAAPEADADSQPDWSVGDAVEAVRRALGPFDVGTRRKVVRAALTFLK